MRKIIMFDVDGVLINSVERSIASLCGILTKHGLDVDYNLITKNWGHSFANVLIPALAESGNWADYKKEIVLREANDFFETAHFGGPLHVKEKLEELHSVGHGLGIITNRSSRMLDRALGEIDVDKNIFDLLHSSDSGICKPDPRVFERVLRHKADREIVFIGDSLLCDLPAAYGCQPRIIFVGITSVIHRKDDFIQAGVPENLVYDSVTDYIDELLVSR